MEGIQYRRSVNALEKGRIKGNGFYKLNKSEKFSKIGNRTNKTRTYFIYSKLGYITRNYRLKNKVIRQLNILAIDNDQVDKEEWEVISRRDSIEQDKANLPNS